MRIERIDLLGVGRYLFVQVHTDAGISGLGEAGAWGYLDSNAAVVRAWEPYLIGQDPLKIEHHWQYLYRSFHFRGSAVTGALGAIDSALWDIKGKRYEAPIHELMGGRVRDRVRVQTSVHKPTLEETLARARADVARGITCLRLDPSPPGYARMRRDELFGEMVRRVGALRETIGPAVDIGIEMHRHLSPGDAIGLADELRQFRPLYFEDPIVPESIQTQNEISRQIALPVATGERLLTIWEFRELLVGGGARYIRPDVCLVGGLTVAKKIAAIAESFHVGVMPHGALSNVSTAVAVQLDACIPNFVVQDFLWDDEPPKNDYLVENLKLENGYVVLPEGPGIGVELKPGLAEKYPYKPVAMNTPLREDGSVAGL